MTRIVRNFLAPVLVLSLAAIIAWAMVNSRADLPRREQVTVAPSVDSVSVTPGAVSTTIRSRGTVAAKHVIELVSEVSGRVKWVDPGFLQGEQVKEGQTLLRIDPIDYEVALSNAHAGVASAELSLAEVQVVVKRAAIDEAEARVEAAKARLRQAQADLDNTAIKAPFDAIVDIKRVDLGQYVQAGNPVMKLLSTSKAEVRLPVLAADIPFLQYGQRPDGSWHQATLISHFGNLDFRWQARLLRLEKRVDERTRVFYLIAEIEQPYDTQRHKHPLSVGLFVAADIPGRKIENAVRLPRSAIHAGSLVYRVEQGTLRKREVTVLRKEQDTVIVGEGLDLGDIVVLSRLDLMVDGMAVSVEP